MGDLFAEIRKQHIEDYGSKFEEWAPRILVDQYSDRTHFIYELIQNAEDAGATYLTFNLYPDRLVLCHNGKPFTEADIRGICGIRSTKDERTPVKLEDLALDSNRFMRIPKRQLSILDNMRLEFKI